MPTFHENLYTMGLDPTKEYMKIKFLTEDLQETADKMFSLSYAHLSRKLIYNILDVKGRFHHPAGRKDNHRLSQTPQQDCL